MSAAIWVVIGVLWLVNIVLWFDRTGHELPTIPLITTSWRRMRSWLP